MAQLDEELHMYLKKVDGPRQVTLPDGVILSRADLPPADTRRWVASRKAIVVKAVIYGLLTQAEALVGVSSTAAAKSCCASRRWPIR